MKISGYEGRHNTSGERIRMAREKAGLSQSQLAARLQVKGIGINQKAISRIETGERIVTDYELACLIESLQVVPLWLLLGDKENS